jgi:hypothetical protein
MPIITIAGIQVEGLEFRTPFVRVTPESFAEIRQHGSAGLIIEPAWQRRIAQWEKMFSQVSQVIDVAATYALSGDLVQNTTAVQAQEEAALALATQSVQQDYSAQIADLERLANYESISLPQGLSMSDAPTFAGITLTGLTAGSVPFIGTGGVVSEDNARFFWDSTNHRLALLNAAPTKTLDIGASHQFTVDSSGNMVANSVSSATYSAAGTVTFQNVTSGDLDFLAVGNFNVSVNGTPVLAIDNTGLATFPGIVNAVTNFQANGTPGITGTLTTGSLAGKTLTFTNGIITNFA